MEPRMKKAGIAVAAVAALSLGGAAIANATGLVGSGKNSSPVPAAAARHASTAALAATGGGKVNAIERDSEKGATFEVEVRRPDGKTVDVRLDSAYKLVEIDGDSESGDNADTGADQADESAG